LVYPITWRVLANIFRN